MRRSVDTNLLVRFVLRDDPAQASVAQDILTGDCWVSLTVAVELYWVLSRWAQMSRSAVCDAFELLLAIGTMGFERQNGLSWAVERCRTGADLPDMLHIVASASDADAFVTFDRKLARQAGKDTPVKVETLKS